MNQPELDLPGTAVRVLPDHDALAAEIVRRILDAAAAAISERGAFRICLAGGSTPMRAYRVLADRAADWAAWHIYHGDERCLPPDDPERNSHAADAAWLSRVAVPREQVFTIAAERGPSAAADAYEPLVAAALPFDLVLLGIGEDGHTASLFPGHAVPDRRLVIPVHNAPKPPPERVSLTPRALCTCRALLILASGAGKAAALARWRDGEKLPVASVAAGAPSEVLLDRAALPD